MASSSAGTSTISPTKGTRRSNPLDEVHLEELLARLQKRSREDDDELEVVSERISDKTGLKRRRASASSTVESKTVWSSFHQTKHTTRDTVAQGGAFLSKAQKGLVAPEKRFQPPQREKLPQAEKWFQPSPLSCENWPMVCMPLQRVITVPLAPADPHRTNYEDCAISQRDCPECARPMYEAPRRDCALEEEIRHRYPEWTDGSVVTYSFARFTFPRRPVA
ncbi:hypothetical protein C8F01DRAFT_1081514 [Mycena amicta]|nr:hypothetical protein C8F01DRAFT_1081514 [Mycena amicta]